jgi:hypothetical protein
LAIISLTEKYPALSSTNINMKATYYKYNLQFKRPSGTSRGVMTEKENLVYNEEEGKTGIGECGILRGLSDDRPDYEEKLQWTCANIHLGKDQLWEALIEFPSIQFELKWRSSLYTAKLFFTVPFRIY